MRHTLSYHQSTISYLRFGTGDRLLFCFHGFGDRAGIWYHLEKKLGKKFTFIAIDLPFHGQTVWEQKTLQIRDFEAIVKNILRIENKERFSLAGFSFGVRIVEQLLFSHSPVIDTILLFAPDGMGTKGLGNATLLPVFLRRAVCFLLKKPDKIVKLVNWLHKKKLVGQPVYWFFSQNMSDTHRRKRIFFYWLSLDDFEVKLSLFKKKLQETGVITHVFLGKHDEITPLSIGTFLTANAPNVQLYIVESGHQILAHLPDFDVSRTSVRESFTD